MRFQKYSSGNSGTRIGGVTGCFSRKKSVTWENHRWQQIQAGRGPKVPSMQCVMQEVEMMKESTGIPESSNCVLLTAQLPTQKALM